MISSISSSSRNALKILSKLLFFLIIAFTLSALFYVDNGFSTVEQEKGKIYIVDRMGERWDITQAVSIGFDPKGFQFGIGRNSFTPLDDTSLRDNTTEVRPGLRILGISDNSDDRAYSIPKLSGHEIANSMIGSTPIAAAY